MNLFYISELRGSSAWFDAEETRHCFKVFRHRMGDELTATDGKGSWFRLKLKKMIGEKAELDVLEKMAGKGEHAGDLVMAVSPLRLPDRFEWLLEKAVELGATRIVPVITERTIRATLRTDRLEKILIAALKQSCRSVLPAFDAPMTLVDFLAEPAKGLCFAGFCESSLPLTEIESSVKSSDSIRILIGPEGDFTDGEVEMMQNASYKIVSFGGARLRTETAAIFALSFVKGLKGW